MAERPSVISRETPKERVAPSWRVRLHFAVEAPTLGHLVLRRGLVTEQQLAQAIAIQRLSGERLGHVLVRLEYLGKGDLDHLLSRQRLLRWLNYFFG